MSLMKSVKLLGCIKVLKQLAGEINNLDHYLEHSDLIVFCQCRV